MKCLKCIVSGQVQGVFYRDTAQRNATSLGITGYAVNLPNGKVEVLMCGSETQLKKMEEFLWQGSSWSNVATVQCQGIDINAPMQFTTG